MHRTPDHGPHLLDAPEAAAERIAAFCEGLDPVAQAFLTLPATAMTLAGLKGHATIYDAEALSDDAVSQVSERAEEHGMVASTEWGCFYVWNTEALARTTAASRLPGVHPFEEDWGERELLEWSRLQQFDLLRAIDRGEYPAGNDPIALYQGVICGYPDRCVLDFAELFSGWSQGRTQETWITDVTAGTVRRFRTGEEWYDGNGADAYVLEAHADDPDVRRYVSQGHALLAAMRAHPQLRQVLAQPETLELLAAHERRKTARRLQALAEAAEPGGR